MTQIQCSHIILIKFGSTESCQSADTLRADFTRMRHDYKARYVRLYAWCDDGGTFLNNVIQSAYSAGLGVIVTIWFGYVLPDLGVFFN
jgi:exo-beta-1,3-glucanase (GH17 family)